MKPPTGLISIDGTPSPLESGRIPAIDRGFLYGQAVFETLVAFDGKAIEMPEHFERLRRSADMVGLTVPWGDKELSFELEALLEQTPFPKANIRLMVTGGDGFGLANAATSPRRVVMITAAKIEDEALFARGLKLKRKALPYTIRNSLAKVSDYSLAARALMEAKAGGFDEILWSNSEQEITEAATANIFFLERTGDHVSFVTPAINSGILAGITRKRLLTLMTQAGIPAQERIVFVEELPRFDEAFVCSTVRGLIPVASVDQHRFHTTRPQSTYAHIARLYESWVNSVLGFRVHWNTGAKQV